MEQISQIFKKTLDNQKSIREEAERVLEGIIIDTQTLELFFQYISSETIDLFLRKAALIFLNKYLVKYWFNDSDAALANPNKVLQKDTQNAFKSNILNLLALANPNLILLVKDSIISLVNSAHGYMAFWPELMTKLVEILHKKNYVTSTEIYHLIQKVIKRYHIESKSAALFDEIINTMKELCPILTEDALRFSKYLIDSKLSNDSLQCLVLIKRIMQIFYSLNYQDFPEFFEDHLQEWLAILGNCLLFVNECNDIYEMVIKVKSKTMKCVNLYFQNYFDDIRDFSTQFYPIIWKLIFIIKKEDQYTPFVKELLDFYKVSFQYQRITNTPQEDVQILIQNLILPNIKMTPKEMDEFQDNPINFLKVELEEADMDSNKYHAINLLKNLINIYKNMPNDFIQPMIHKLLNDYYANPNSHWNDKIIAINLIFAIYIKTFAQRIGVTEMNPNIQGDLISLINEVFTKEFQTPNTPNTAKMYSMKFLTTFRLQIPSQFLGNVIDLLINILNNTDKVCQSACLLTLEKILFMKDMNTREPLTKDAVNNQTTFSNLITSLVKFIVNDTNVFAIRCFYRTIFLTHEQYYNSILTSLNMTMNDILKNIIINSQQDEFNFYYFETCSLIIKKLALIDLKMVTFFMGSIQEQLGSVLGNTVTDLMGYTFQLFAYYLYVTGDQNEYYSKLLSSILYDQNSWSLNMKYMFNPFISFIKVSFMKKNDFYTQNNGSLTQIIQIAEMLLKLKCYPQMFELLDHLIHFFNPLSMISNFNTIMNICYNFHKENKVTNLKAYKEFGKELLVFIGKLIMKLNPDNVLLIFNQITNNCGFVYLNELFDEFSYIENNKAKKICLWGFCLFISHFCQSIPIDILKQLTIKLIRGIQSFYKINFDMFGSSEVQDISYAAHNYNKLYNANVVYDIQDYQKIYEADEKQTFFNAMSSIQQRMNGNLVAAVMDQLCNKEKDYIKTAAEKFNFPLSQ